MQFIIIFLIALAYFIIGFFLTGIACGIDEIDFFKDPRYLLVTILWPIVLIVVGMLSFVYLGIKLGKKLQKWK